MKKLTFLFLFCAALLSCSEDEGMSNNPNGNTPIQAITDSDFALQNFGTSLTTNFSGIINDTDGNVVSGVQITIGSQATSTDQNGVFVLNDASVYENFAHITATKSGYIAASRAVVPLQTSVNEIRITLLAQNTIATVAAGEASVVSLPNGATVDFAGGFITATGEAYTGSVAVSAHYLAPNQAATFTQMPGMLYGKRTDGTATGMETYGMLSVNLYGANGAVLNIDPNTPATLTLPVATSTPNAPESMPLWYFDETTGYWKEEGIASKVGSNYVAEVTHFTWWNCDFPIDTVNACFSLSATNTLADFYFEIVRNETNQMVYAGYTNDVGQTCGLLPKDENLTLQVYGSCSNEVIYTQSIGPYSVDFTTIYNLSLPTEYAETTLTANVTDCEGNTLANGYAVLGNDSTSATEVVSIINGEINHALVYCTANNYYIKVYDADADVNSEAINLSLITPETSLGTLSACGNVTYQIGDLVAGGVVFYVAPTPTDLDGDGIADIGLVCALSDYDTSVEWGCVGTDLPNVPNVAWNNGVPEGSGAEIGDGMANTNAILNYCPDAPAALAARSFGTDWFLPSVKELNEMYENKDALESVPGFDEFIEITASSNVYYWSSTEYASSTAWSLDFGGVFQIIAVGVKNDTDYVRAVRAF